MICNSLGSNFATFAEAIKPLSIPNNPNYHQKLTAFLEDKYVGKVNLLYKGREAIELALKLARVPKGSYVTINGFTCIALYDAITNQGLHVAYLDIDQDTLNFSAKSLEQACKTNSNIKAVIVQNSLGFACDIRGIKQVCEEQRLILIEDLAHSIGTIYGTGEEAGTVGDFTVLSFSQDKIIDSIAGGALITRNKKFLTESPKIQRNPVPPIIQCRDRFHPLVTWTIRATYRWHVGKVLHALANKLHLLARPMEDLGRGFHQLPNWQCQLALSQLEKLRELLQHRQSIATIYADNLPKNMLLNTSTQHISQSSCLRFPLLVKNPPKLLNLLKKHNFYLADIWYDAPIAPAKYIHLTTYNHECPNAESMITHIFNVPTHRSITEQQAKQLVELIKICQK